jgi:dihydroorotate dehydrogenase
VFDYYRALGPALRLLDPERAHRLAIALAGRGLLPPVPPVDDPVLRCRVLGLDFANPVGLAAGFDKNAEATDAMLGQGFGFVEVGTVTPRPQAGNPRPRVFRLEDDAALINRLGFNGDGLGRVADRLAAWRRRGAKGIVGANVGPNRDAADPIADCAEGVRTLAPLVDYLVINVSSPNTPGLRGLQAEGPLADLLQRALAARAGTGHRPPLLLKIAPDLDDDALAAIARLALAAGIDGLIATNTTVDRPTSLVGRHRAETGGLSGRPLFARATAVLAKLHRLTGGRVPLIGVGGIASAGDAYAKIRAGASLVQLYTALVYQGPWLVARINRGLGRLLRQDGFASVADAVGTAPPPPA